MATRGKGWSNVLLMIRLLFTVSVSNAKPERVFSKLKRVKTDFRCLLGVKPLENILKNMEEGSNWETFDLILAKRSGALIKLDAKQRRKDHVAKSHVILLKWMLNL